MCVANNGIVQANFPRRTEKKALTLKAANYVVNRFLGTYTPMFYAS